MPKIICHMLNGFEFAHYDARVRVPAEPTELEVEHDWQIKMLKGDCRVAVLTEVELEEYQLAQEEVRAERLASSDAADSGYSKAELTKMPKGDLQIMAEAIGVNPDQNKPDLVADILAAQ